MIMFTVMLTIPPHLAKTGLQSMTKQVDHNDQRTQIPQRLVLKLQFLLDYSSIMVAAENARNDSSLVLTPLKLCRCREPGIIFSREHDIN